MGATHCKSRDEPAYLFRDQLIGVRPHSGTLIVLTLWFRVPAGSLSLILDALLLWSTFLGGGIPFLLSDGSFGMIL
jgi:hypothetical protein